MPSPCQILSETVGFAQQHPRGHQFLVPPARGLRFLLGKFLLEKLGDSHCFGQLEPSKRGPSFELWALPSRARVSRFGLRCISPLVTKRLSGVLQGWNLESRIRRRYVLFVSPRNSRILEFQCTAEKGNETATNNERPNS